MALKIGIEHLPREAFLNSELVQDIGYMRIMTRNEKKNVKPGSPDVEIGFTGRKPFMVDRDTAIKELRTPDNKDIVIGALREGKKYLVTMPTRQKVLVFNVPKSNGNSKMEFTLNNKTLPTGSFVVFMASGSKGTAPLVLNKDYFNKMIVVTEKNSGAYKDRLKKALLRYAKAAVASDRIKNNKLSTAEKVRYKEEIRKAEENNSAPYHIVGRIDRRESYTTIGYIISNGQKTKAFNIAQTINLCKRKLIRNATCVRNQNGKEFIRGVGITLDSLPVTYK